MWHKRFHFKNKYLKWVSECEWINLLWPYCALYELTDTHWVTNIILTIYCLDQSPAGNHSSQQCRKWQRSCEHQPSDTAWGTADSRAQCVRESFLLQMVCVCKRAESEESQRWCLMGGWGQTDCTERNAYLYKPVWDCCLRSFFFSCPLRYILNSFKLLY